MGKVPPERIEAVEIARLHRRVLILENLLEDIGGLMTHRGEYSNHIWDVLLGERESHCYIPRAEDLDETVRRERWKRKRK